MTKENITGEILSSIDNKNDFTEIMKTNHGNKENELLFFFKPEVFLASEKSTKEEIINSTLEKFNKFNAEICSVTQISGPTLKKYEIMDRHYGFINTVSKNASKMLTLEEKQKMCEMMEIKYNDDLKFYGGHEFLEANDNFTPYSLDTFWATKKSIKLKGGFYFQNYDIEGESVILVDAFHPAQLSHFTEDHKNIVIVLLSSDTDWKSLRDDLVGDTFPENAAPESIRGELLHKKDELKLEDVSIANNFCHLSAGPFEAFFEINNFYSNLIENFDLSDANIYKKLEEKDYDKDKILKALENPIAGDDDLFDETEHCNTSDSIELYTSKYN